MNIYFLILLLFLQETVFDLCLIWNIDAWQKNAPCLIKYVQLHLC